MSVAENDYAISRRQSLPRVNQFSIQELLQLPAYWGWVDCQAASDVQFQMLLCGSDDGVALRFFWNGHYERTTLRVWCALARTSKLAIDIGAHTGVYTLGALAANRACKVASFEPHCMNFARMSINLRYNGFVTSDAFMLAAGAKTEVVPFTIHTALDYLTAGGVVGCGADGIRFNVQAVRMDTFLPPSAFSLVSLIKIDVEGSEAACLHGMEAIIYKSSPDIFFECLTAKGGRDVQAFLEPLGYCFLEIDDRDECVVPVKEVRPAYESPGRLALNRRNRIASTEPNRILLWNATSSRDR